MKLFAHTLALTALMALVALATQYALTGSFVPPEQPCPRTDRPSVGEIQADWPTRFEGRMDMSVHLFDGDDWTESGLNFARSVGAIYEETRP